MSKKKNNKKLKNGRKAMKKLILLLALLSCLAPMYSEEIRVTNDKAVGCVNYGTYYTLISSYDDDGIIRTLLSSGDCFTIDPGVKVKVLAKSQKHVYINLHGIGVYLAPFALE